VRQPLAAIVANSQAALHFLANSPPDLDETRAALRSVVNEGLRAGEVIESVRAMFRNVDQEMVPIDITKVVRDMLELMHAELRANRVALQAELDDNLPNVSGNRIQLQQVILNLIRNAVDAMKSAPNRARVLRIRSAIAEPDGVLVSVEDTGSGIDPKDVDRIFDSFFTTKPQGTGMGLSICRSIIEGHQGRLWASSRVDHGAVLNVHLPTARCAAGRTPPAFGSV
jgi:signal transduction histidine kinase